MTPALRAAWAVAIRLPAYVAIARMERGGLRTLPRRVVQSWRIFYATEKR